MKTKFILAGFLAFSAAANAQFSTASAPAPILSNGQRVGINTTSPQNELDVFTNDPNYWAGGIGITQQASTGSAALHLLSTNAGGNLWGMYSLGNGNHIGGTSNIGDFAIFNETSSRTPFIINRSTGNVGINSLAPIAKLQVEQSTAPMAGYFNAYAGFGGASVTTGLFAKADQWNLGTGVLNMGLNGEATAGSQTYGQSIGTGGFGYHSKYTYGGYFIADGRGNCDFGGENYGVYGYATGGCRNWAGYFAGNVIASSYSTFSDQKLKKNITAMTGALEKIKLLKPSTYTYKTDEYKEMALPEGKQLGLIAQELEEVFPELIGNVTGNAYRDPKSKTPLPLDPAGYKVVNYMSLIPVLIAGIQEQQKLIEEQAKINGDQQKLIEELMNKKGSAMGISQFDPTPDGFSLEQNVPNPFNNETVIKYSLPQQIKNASLVVYDLSGKKLISFPLDNNATSLSITAEKLAAGIYIYSVMADGKILDSKRMVIAE